MTPERIAEIEKLAETMMTKFLSCEPDPVKVREFETALMELIGSCLRERDAEIERLRLNNAAQECLLAEAVTGARETEAEVERLRNAMDDLDRLRRQFIFNPEVRPRIQYVQAVAEGRARSGEINPDWNREDPEVERLRARVAALEKVREAAQALIGHGEGVIVRSLAPLGRIEFDPGYQMAKDALEAALKAARGE